MKATFLQKRVDSNPTEHCFSFFFSCRYCCSLYVYFFSSALLETSLEAIYNVLLEKYYLSIEDFLRDILFIKDHLRDILSEVTFLGCLFFIEGVLADLLSIEVPLGDFSP